MANTHQIGLLQNLIKENNLQGIELVFGKSKQTVIQVKINNQTVIRGGGTINMSNKNHELFELIMEKYHAMNNTSMATAKVEPCHDRGNYESQTMCYVKDNNTIDKLEETLGQIYDELDEIDDNKLIGILRQGKIKEYLTNLLIEYSYTPNQIKSYHELWNSEDGTRTLASSNDLITLTPNMIITKVIFNKIKRLQKRAEELARV